MERSKNFEKVKKFYKEELWDRERVKMAVIKSWITKQEFEEITGEIFET